RGEAKPRTRNLEVIARGFRVRHPSRLLPTWTMILLNSGKPEFSRAPSDVQLHIGESRLRIEHDDAAHRLAGLHRGKTLVDLRQLQLRRDPVLEMQLAAHVEFDEPRHVDAEMVRAHRRALDFSFAQEIEAVQL